MRKTAIPLVLFIIVIFCSSWGFFAHRRINNLAVFTLPGGMIRFYKNNLNYLTEHAVDPDKRRYSDSLEAPRHFLDADHYGASPFDSLPQRYEDAVAKYSKDTIHEHGILPWHIQNTYYSLVNAFKDVDSARILRISAALGHYIADAHVPLHTTRNYNGQLTGQQGIHGFWESRLPELFAHRYDYLVGRATYIENPLRSAWQIVRTSYGYVDPVLEIERQINEKFPSDKKFTYSQRNGKVLRQYSEEYAQAYHRAMSGLVERQMRASIHAIGSFWYSAWVDAGQPRLEGFKKIPQNPESEAAENQEEAFKKGKIIGRMEEE